MSDRSYSAHVELTDEAIIEAIRGHRSARATVLRLGVSLIGVTAVVSMMTIGLRPFPMTLVPFVPPLVVAAAFAYYFRVVWPRQVAASFKPGQRAYDITASEAGLELSSAAGRSELGWDAVERVQETPRAWFVELQNRVMVLVLKAPFPEEDRAGLSALLRERCPSPPAPRGAVLKAAALWVALLVALTVAYASFQPSDPEVSPDDGAASVPE
mgnify:CR=1 FL=1